MSDPANVVRQTEEDDKDKATQVSPQASPKTQVTSSSSDNLFALIFWAVIIGGVVIYNNLPARKFFVDYWWVFGIALVLLVIVITMFKPLRQKIKSNVHTRVGTIIVALAGIAILEGAISILQPRYQILALRSTFLLVVCLFPVILYYLFITTRKYSLLNEFITNLDRLGLLAKQSRAQSATPYGTDAIAPRSGVNLRILAYVQKFEAVYGAWIPTL